MPSTRLTFSSRAEHRSWLRSQAVLPSGFRVGTAPVAFTAAETGKAARMTVTLIAMDRPTPHFGAVFTRNAFPGAPVIIGRQRLAEPTLGAVVVNNKVSNVGAPDGVAASERVCAAVAASLGLAPTEVLPSSTGVIGWRLPADEIVAALPAAVAALADSSLSSAAEGIMTTDLYPKVRRVPVGGGSIVGLAKGAGMIEPNLATMLAFILTDVAVPREALRLALARTVDRTFNAISVDGDTSTSDTVALVSSALHAPPPLDAFERALTTVCGDLAEDVVRNGEGVHHVLRVIVRGAADAASARGMGKAIVNSPLFKCAVAGNDPNVGRLVAALGKHVGALHPTVDLRRLRIHLGGQPIFERGEFRLSRELEATLVRHLKLAELYASDSPREGLFRPPIDYPPHERTVEIDVDLGAGDGEATVLGADLTHEYLSENADYRS